MLRLCVGTCILQTPDSTRVVKGKAILLVLPLIFSTHPRFLPPPPNPANYFYTEPGDEIIWWEKSQRDWASYSWDIFARSDLSLQKLCPPGDRVVTAETLDHQEPPVASSHPHNPICLMGLYMLGLSPQQAVDFFRARNTTLLFFFIVLRKELTHT